MDFRLYWPTCVRTPWFLKLAPWRRECFAPLADGFQITRDDRWHPENLKRDFEKSNFSRSPRLCQNDDHGPHVRSDFKPRVDTLGIYVDNHYNRSRQFSIWMRFNCWNLHFRWVFQCCVNMFFFETCALEESASHEASKAKSPENIIQRLENRVQKSKSTNEHNKSSRHDEQLMIVKLNQDMFRDL